MANKQRFHRTQVRQATHRPAGKPVRFASISYSPRFASILQPLSAVFHPSLSFLLRLLISAALLALLLLMRSYAEAQENTGFNHVNFPLVGSSNEPTNLLSSH